MFDKITALIVRIATAIKQYDTLLKSENKNIPHYFAEEIEVLEQKINFSFKT
jgi:hypothetical protein